MGLCHRCHGCHLLQFQARVKIANEGVNGWITGPLGAVVDVAAWNGRMVLEFGGRTTMILQA